MNIPNAISTFRLCLVPVFAYVYFNGGDYATFYAFGIFALAGFSDVLDGYIARKYNMVTMLGRIIDPLADKLMVWSALICTAVAGHIHPFFPVAYFVKEGWQGIQAFRLAGRISDVPPANFWGKGATFLYYVSITIAMLLPGKGNTAAFVTLCAAIIFSLVAYYTYRVRGKRLVDEADKAKESTKGGN
ncbi:MAG: CDP-alcohol phosphatidyltransferase family protein [Clostridia bacterium]|nr:CDP-alcohol phosphatidyltransferase family protein [Oscillospiraceae bacterium]MBQ6867343.1 CDP-alcohol phosphatidyltransferase family protein [Clostridia bacterium]MBQ7085886.1 CDP-alcohol phosphatidyltransferase family protein [Clostridia bacterium]